MYSCTEYVEDNSLTAFLKFSVREYPLPAKYLQVCSELVHGYISLSSEQQKTLNLVIRCFTCLSHGYNDKNYSDHVMYTVTLLHSKAALSTMMYMLVYNHTLHASVHITFTCLWVMYGTVFISLMILKSHFN